MNKQKTVAIIGAGESGLAAAKYALEYGLVPEIFDKSNTFGGLWGNSTAIYDGLNANISYFTMSYSDHNYPNRTSIIPSKKEVYKYFESYIEKFNLKKYLRLNTQVLHVQQDKTYNKWAVTSINLCDEQKTEVFDFLIIASGLHSRGKIPAFQNIENFKGTIIHSSQFKIDDDKFKSKKVVVIGASFSSSDLSSHLVGHASSVVNIFRRPYLIAKRLLHFKNENNEYNIRPIDACFHTRSYVLLKTKEEKINYYLKMFPDQLSLDENHPLHINPSEIEFPKISISDFYLDHVQKGLKKDNF